MWLALPFDRWPMGSVLRTHVGLGGDPVPASPITQTPWHDRAKNLGMCAPTWPGLLASSSSTEGQLRAARVGMFASSQPPCQTCLPASPPPPSVSLRLPHAQGVLIGVPLLPPSVTEWQEAGSRTGWARLVHLCPLIRCFRQGGGRCGYSLPAHGCGVWQGQGQGQTSLALS